MWAPTSEAHHAPMFLHHDFTIALADERRHHLRNEAAGLRLARAVRRARRRPSAPSTASPPRIIDLRVKAAAPRAAEDSGQPHHNAA